MKLLALGGCGGMGQFAVRTALAYDFIESITIADADMERAKKFSAVCGPKTTPTRLNIEDGKALGKHLSEHDIVLATVGPYYRFGMPILKAAIENRCHYIDICDDWEPTLEMLSLHDEAKLAGITAVIGMGASPGLSNMLAIKAMNALDSTETLITGWGQGSHSLDAMTESDQGGSYGAAYEHWFHQLTGTIRVRQNGRYEDFRPFQEIMIDFPGIGSTRTYSLGHPEPLTIPRYRPEIMNSVNVMDFEAGLIEIVRWIAGRVDRKKFTLKDAVSFFMQIEKKGIASLLFSKACPALIKGVWREMIYKRTPLPTIFALATGKKYGKAATAGARLKGIPYGGLPKENMGGATGVPAGAAISLFHQNKIKTHGVFAPEGIIHPDDMFDAIAPLCTPAFKNGEELIEIVIGSKE